MSFKTITVFVDASTASAARLETAVGLAAAQGAHLVAVACTRQIDLGVYAMPGAEMAVDFSAIDRSREEAQALAAQVAAKMEAAGAGNDARWASSIATGLSETAARSARHSDLSVVGPAGGPGVDGEIADAVLEGTLFNSGRPVLMVPAGWTGASLGRTVMVAWDGSHVAARAVHDALPFIETADKVTIAIVDPDPGVDGTGEEPGADIAAVLARHGAKVEVQTLARAGASVAERLQATAVEIGADLLVMGGYGHSRLREAIFSGVSRTVLEAPAVPVLIAH
ncbi:Universal stress protein family protein [Albimonas donghaensis]|uniref:Universal stress protein family protein n=1 Tax=Albimonas donghaensis TaxID=356660 RepID=A0A1H2YEF4_9RHOB|nr:universal stress protein [Albimonas donghaensis]SDX03440.1 Universal stress protein family protein [Albimonas donghaensis]